MLKCINKPSQNWKIFKKEVQDLVDYSNRQELEEHYEDAAKAILLAAHLMDHYITSFPEKRDKYIPRNMALIEELRRLRPLAEIQNRQRKQDKLDERQESDHRRSQFVINVNFRPLPPIPEKISKIIESIQQQVLKQPENISWNDIVGHDKMKTMLKKLFAAQLELPYAIPKFLAKGCLVFGPPGINQSVITR